MLNLILSIFIIFIIGSLILMNMHETFYADTTNEYITVTNREIIHEEAKLGIYPCGQGEEDEYCIPKKNIPDFCQAHNYTTSSPGGAGAGAGAMIIP